MISSGGGDDALGVATIWPSGNNAALVVSCMDLFSFEGLVFLPFTQPVAVHEKQMSFMAREGDCPSAPSRAPVFGVHWSEAEALL